MNSICKTSIFLFAIMVVHLVTFAGSSPPAKTSMQEGRKQDHHHSVISVPYRRRHRGIGHAYKGAGKSAGRGGRRFARNMSRGKPLKAGKELGRGMGGFGKGVGQGTGRTGRKTGKAVKHAVAP